MTRVELHIDNPDNPDGLEEWRKMIKETLTDLGLATEHCEFTIARNSPELVRTAKNCPFIRIVITPEDSVGKIVQSIRRFLPEFDGLGIDIVTMPMYVPPGIGWGRWSNPPGSSKPRWYDPDDTMRSAEYHSRKAGEERG